MPNLTLAELGAEIEANARRALSEDIGSGDITAQLIPAERLAKARFQAGATGVQAWLDEQNRLWDAQQSLLAQQKEQLTTTAKIYRALGGSDSVAPR